ncbi:MAG: sugar transferase [Chlorobi bacterium]|nr:sugar transferase [Chlorobiota bacterium]
MNYDLIIFDCDGVLVDSETIGNRVIAEIIREHGHQMSTDQALATFRGRQMAQCMEIISRLLQRELPEGFLDAMRARMGAALEAEVLAVEGIETALEAIDLPVCVASSGPVAKIRMTLGRTGLLPRFEGRLFSSYDIGSWKPAPDLFLHAARTLGADPARCAVVEDSIHGVRAGIAAGMTVFGFATGDDARLFAAEGARVFARMEELPALLLEAGKSHRAS